MFLRLALASPTWAFLFSTSNLYLSSSIIANSCPLFTISPSSTNNLAIFPSTSGLMETCSSGRKEPTALIICATFWIAGFVASTLTKASSFFSVSILASFFEQPWAKKATINTMIKDIRLFLIYIPEPFLSLFFIYSLANRPMLFFKLRRAT